jgi:hypothetical protein
VHAIRALSTWPATTRTGTGAPVVTFDLGDLYASEPKPLLVELLVDRNAVDPDEVARLTVRADVLRADGAVEARTLHLPLAASLAAQDTMHPEIEQAVLLADAAQAREDAARRQREGDGRAAAQVMTQMSARLREGAELADAGHADELRQQATDLDTLGARYAAGHFSERDAKYQLQRGYNTRRGKHAYDAVIRRRNDDADAS